MYTIIWICRTGDVKYYYSMMDIPSHWCYCRAGPTCTEFERLSCLVMLVRAYSGLGSLVFCSSTNKFCCWSTCIQNDFQQFPLLHVFNNCIVCSGLSYLCLLLRMCNAYAELGLFPFIYLMDSLCLISTDNQSGQHMICYMFWIAICISCWNLFCFVFYRIADCIWCYMLEMLCLSRYFRTSW